MLVLALIVILQYFNIPLTETEIIEAIERLSIRSSGHPVLRRYSPQSVLQHHEELISERETLSNRVFFVALVAEVGVN